MDGSGNVVAYVDFSLGGKVGVFPEELSGFTLRLNQAPAFYAFDRSKRKAICAESEGLRSPVLRVGSTVHDLDNDLPLLRLGDRRVDNLDIGALANNGFLHGSLRHSRDISIAVTNSLVDGGMCGPIDPAWDRLDVQLL